MFKISLNNKQCIFDSAEFDTVEEALIWACSHGGKFNILIDEFNEQGEMIDGLHYSYNGVSLKKEVGYMAWEYVKVPQGGK